MEKELLRQIDREVAWNVLRGNFSGAPRRFVSGVVVSSDAKNSKGVAFKAHGLKVTLPVLLLWSHDFLRPIGKVYGIEARAGAVHFQAEIANSGRLSWAEDIWDAIVDQRANAASVGPRNLANYAPHDGIYRNWGLREISIVERGTGADKGALLERAWEVAPVVHLYRPSVTQHWSTR